MYTVETLPVEEPTDVMLTAYSNNLNKMVDRQRVVLTPSSETPVLESLLMNSAAIVGGRHEHGALLLR